MDYFGIRIWDARFFLLSTRISWGSIMTALNKVRPKAPPSN